MIKTKEEQERLDKIFEEIDFERRRASGTLTQKELDTYNRIEKEKRRATMGMKEVISVARGKLKDNSCKTQWEKIFAQALVDIIDKNRVLNNKDYLAYVSELNLLRNFSAGVVHHFERTEKSIKKQEDAIYESFFKQIKRLQEAL